MARIKLGFNLEGDGLASIFLMYGTPHHAPAAGLREALRVEPLKISRKEMQKAMDLAMASKDPIIQARWARIPRSGEKVTLEEFVEYVATQVSSNL